MQFQSLLCLVAVIFTARAKAASEGIDPPAQFKELLRVYSRSIDANIPSRSFPGAKCSKKTLSIRRSWDSLSHLERKEYIRAVTCLYNKRTVADPKLAPGNRNRLDDFTYTHINQTNFIHFSGYFLAWHRYYIWAFEETLRNECGYKGNLPYWDYGRYSPDQSKSPLFDGSETSFGGNGREVKNRTGFDSFRLVGPPHSISGTVPPGSGGGCITSGPFKDFVITLGPVTPLSPPHKNDPYGLKSNPRCITRDFRQQLSRKYLSWKNILNLVNNSDIETLNLKYDVNPSGVHANSHASVGGTAFDIYASPNDPTFYLLHAQIDRLWAIWQGQDFEERRKAIYGTKTWGNVPPSANVTENDTMEFLYAQAGRGKIRVGDVGSTVDGPFCFKYE